MKTNLDEILPEIIQEECRKRRRHRIKIRRLSAAKDTVTVKGSSTNNKRKNKQSKSGTEKRLRTSSDFLYPSPPAFPSIAEVIKSRPVYGAMSVTGRARDMEDAIFVMTSMMNQSVHFFAVYDGHGGAHVSNLCKEKLHVYLEQELRSVAGALLIDSGSPEWEHLWMVALWRTFHRMDMLAMASCGATSSDCGCRPTELALGGSTAVVAIVTGKHVIVANCGDSRAVLSRGGQALPLSRDHKPDRLDEFERIKPAKGKIIYKNGARVSGILAVSRAIGDMYLKKYVISTPEITFTKRRLDDEFLILASDGLWDVMSREVACKVTSDCFQEPIPKPPEPVDLNVGPRTENEGDKILFQTKTGRAAALLTRLALARESKDNISVIVVDLKSGS